MIYSRSFLLIVLLAASITAFSQDKLLQSLDTLSGSVIRQIRQHETEKAWLVTNKDLYTAGEAVWFRSFLLRSAAEKISTRSKYLFVDLVNEKDSVFTKAVLYAKEQQTGGKLLLSDTLPTGHYWLRAYTRSMIAGHPQGAAIIPLYVVNPADFNPSRAAEAKKVMAAGEPPVTVALFAEGGTLVTGIQSAIGISVHDKAGNPLALTGTIKDNHDAVMTNFTTNNSGLARAEFSPDGRKRYKAVVTHEGKELSFPLPAFNPFAGQLSISRSGNNILKLRTVLEDSIYRRDAVTYLLGISRDSLCFASMGSGNYETEVPLSGFPMGIATFLLFDKNYRLLSERRVYINESQLNVSALLDKPSYTRRSKVTLSTNVATKAGQPIPASLTVAVSAGTASWPEEGTNMSTNLVQKALKAGLSNLDLLRLNSLSERDIDLLLMGSPLFYNMETTAREQSSDQLDDSLFMIRGSVRDSKGRPVANQPLTLIAKFAEGAFLEGSTDVAGRFSFALPAFPDSTQFVLQAGNTKGKGEAMKISLDNISFPRFTTPAYLKQKILLSSSRRMAYARQYADTTLLEKSKGWLQPVSLTAKGKPFENDPRRLASGGTILTSEQLMQLGMGNVGTAVLRMPGVQLINGFLRFYGPDQFSGANANSEPAVLLDGNQMSLSGSGNSASSSPVIQFLNSLNPREIDFIEVLKGPEASVYGIRGGEGVIHIHTSSQVHQDFTVEAGNVFKFLRPGYAKPAMFPAMGYDQKERKETAGADVRSTLFWSENELARNDGRSLFNFYTSDVAGPYQVVVTGITGRGELFYKTLLFTNR